MLNYLRDEKVSYSKSTQFCIYNSVRPVWSTYYLLVQTKWSHEVFIGFYTKHFCAVVQNYFLIFSFLYGHTKTLF